MNDDILDRSNPEYLGDNCEWLKSWKLKYLRIKALMIKS